MVGQPTVTVKPSRSDDIIDPHQQLQISEQVRSHFDSILPKRPPKPNRSDPVESGSLSDEPVTTIPELIKFQSLISQSQGIVSDGNVTVEEEFVETGCYKELTGNGFIKVAREEHGDDDGLYDLQVQTGRYEDQVVKSNPATNDWIPSSGDQDEYVSSKPNRSENW
ncbi:hypothetical protein Hdeb2414_s0075g00776271 [Helianthus debilis subsp. tardiflorus]